MDDALSTEPPCLEHRWTKETLQEELLSHRRGHQKNCHRKVQKYLWLIFFSKTSKNTRGHFRLFLIPGDRTFDPFWGFTQSDSEQRSLLVATAISFSMLCCCERQFRSWSWRNETRRSLLGRYRLECCSIGGSSSGSRQQKQCLLIIDVGLSWKRLLG